MTWLIAAFIISMIIFGGIGVLSYDDSFDGVIKGLGFAILIWVILGLLVAVVVLSAWVSVSIFNAFFLPAGATPLTLGMAIVFSAVSGLVSSVIGGFAKGVGAGISDALGE